MFSLSPLSSLLYFLSSCSHLPPWLIHWRYCILTTTSNNLLNSLNPTSMIFHEFWLPQTMILRCVFHRPTYLIISFMAQCSCGVDPMDGDNTLVGLVTIFGVWVSDSWYLGIQPWRFWALGLLEEGGADFWMIYDDFSVLSWVVVMILVIYKKLMKC